MLWPGRLGSLSRPQAWSGHAGRASHGHGSTIFPGRDEVAVIALRGERVERSASVQALDMRSIRNHIPAALISSGGSVCELDMSRGHGDLRSAVRDPRIYLLVPHRLLG